MEVLTLDPVAGDSPNVFQGNSQVVGSLTVFGGQFLAQALMAAGATVPPERPPHSLHGYFLRAGDRLAQIRYEVETIRDGRAFSHREVRATQSGRELFRLMASFGEPRPGPEYDEPIETPAVDPNTLPSYADWAVAGTDNPEHHIYSDAAPIDIRYEAPTAPHAGQVVRGTQRLWLRVAADVPDDRLLHAALLAWMSDESIAHFSTLAHGHRWTDLDAGTSSLDHGMWFVRPERPDRWLAFTQEAVVSSGGRTLTRGEMTRPDGTRIAVVNQEVLVTLPGY